ncbi:acid-sensing ion channel 5-like isoform X3 [Branchiostoma floridae]|uniref:Acid-sensing ion channel 5-like isoform X3 n=1 Tax=Branchiostoma floridae TaxID=7739 RepID=A0A9J7LG10_BRAFL|nr:acid-sensing ion channel 5-like isoform X3 [Branchiostoma floridae]
MGDKQDSLDHEFANYTTCHGASRIANAKNRPHMALWTLIFLAAFGLCTWQIVDRFQNYFAYRTGTEINVQLESELDFPAVTICNFNRIRASGVTQRDLTYLWTAMYAPVMMGNPEAVQAYVNSVDWDAFNVSTELLEDFPGYVRRNGFVLNEDTLAQCTWRGVECTAQNFTHVFTEYGNCWTFNSDKNSPLKQTSPGAGNGLKLIMDVQTGEYTEDPLSGNLEYGLIFQVHDQHEPPRPELVGTAVAPGTHTYASTFQTHVKNQPTPWGQCDQNKGRNHLKYYDKYTLPGCLLECRAELVASVCKCTPMYYPGDMDYCTPLNLTACGIPTLATFLKENNEFDACGCTVPCEYTSYSSQVSYAGYPSDRAARFYETTFNYSSGYMSKNVVLLDVYYHELRSTTYEQFKAVDESGLISDVGGQVGFFIGVSVITLFEFLEYLIMKFSAFFLFSRKSSITKPNKDGLKVNNAVVFENTAAEYAEKKESTELSTIQTKPNGEKAATLEMT